MQSREGPRTKQNALGLQTLLAGGGRIARAGGGGLPGAGMTGGSGSREREIGTASSRVLVVSIEEEGIAGSANTTPANITVDIVFILDFDDIWDMIGGRDCMQRLSI